MNYQKDRVKILSKFGEDQSPRPYTFRRPWIEAVHTLVLGVHKDVGRALTGIKGGTHYQVFETISIEVDRC